MKKLLKKLLFLLFTINLAVTTVYSAETEKSNPVNNTETKTIKEKISLWSKAKKIGQGIAGTFKDESSKFAAGLAALFVKKGYERYVDKPIFDTAVGYFESGLTFVSKTLPGTDLQQKIAGAALLATLYIAYKWYTKQEEDQKTVTVDIRPKNFDAFVLLIALGKNRMEIFKDHGYQLENIKADLANKNVAGLNLIPELYPEFIKALTDEQKQYLNGLIKETINSDKDIILEAKTA